MQTIVNLGTDGADLNGRNGSTTSADSNDALFLDWPGDNAGNYVYLPGVASNFLSVPDEAALDITGDIDIRVQVALDDWTPAAGATIICKEQTSSTESWRFSVSNAGILTLRFSATGTGATGTGSSTAAVPFSDGATGWVRVTLDVDNGASGLDFKFYTSDDGVTWTQLGATVTQAGASSINASTSQIEIGSVRNGTSLPLAGKVYRAQILNGIDGTKVLDVDCSQITSGSNTSFTALTGQTVTINRSTSGRKSVAVVSPLWLFGTDDYMTVPTDRRLNFPAGEDRTIIMMYRVWNTVLVNNARVFSKTTSTSAPYYQIRGTSGGSLAVFLDDGTTNIASTMDNPTAGALEMRGMVRNTSTSKLGEIVDGVVNAENNDALGAVEPTSDLHLMSEPGGGTYRDAEMFAFMVFDRVLTDTELTAIDTYYRNTVA